MANLRHFYQVNIHGLPIPGTNINVHKAPISFGKGQRWIEFSAIGELAPCCGSTVVPHSTGRKHRFYVRINPTTNLPVAGSLMKHNFPPTTEHWQEILGHQCC